MLRTEGVVLYAIIRGTRKSAYLEEEKQYMLPLPAVPFEAAVWSVAKVPNDYLVSDGRNKYSVPYNLIGEKGGTWHVSQFSVFISSQASAQV